MKMKKVKKQECVNVISRKALIVIYGCLFVIMLLGVYMWYEGDSCVKDHRTLSNKYNLLVAEYNQLVNNSLTKAYFSDNAQEEAYYACMYGCIYGLASFGAEYELENKTDEFLHTAINSSLEECNNRCNKMWAGEQNEEI